MNRNQRKRAKRQRAKRQLRMAPAKRQLGIATFGAMFEAAFPEMPAYIRAIGMQAFVEWLDEKSVQPRPTMEDMNEAD